jgi:phosphoglycolate phosphatase-like HAD superfamily hydrolase
MKSYVFDIDGTICSLTEGNYSSAQPFVARICLINELYEQGNFIIYQTARGMGSSGNDADKAKQKWETLTKSQLKEWDAKHHLLFMGKPAGDIYVDDKAISDKEFFSN